MIWSSACAIMRWCWLRWQKRPLSDGDMNVKCAPSAVILVNRCGHLNGDGIPKRSSGKSAKHGNIIKRSPTVTDPGAFRMCIMNPFGSLRFNFTDYVYSQELIEFAI